MGPGRTSTAHGCPQRWGKAVDGPKPPQLARRPLHTLTFFLFFFSCVQNLLCWGGSISLRFLITFCIKKSILGAVSGVFPLRPLFFLFVKACPKYVDRAHTHAAVEAAEQQPEGWRFVPDTILSGYQWAPQWVPSRTPTVHWGPISGMARTQFSTAVQCRNTANIFSLFSSFCCSVFFRVFLCFSLFFLCFFFVFSLFFPLIFPCLFPCFFSFFFLFFFFVS